MRHPASRGAALVAAIAAAALVAAGCGDDGGTSGSKGNDSRRTAATAANESEDSGSPTTTSAAADLRVTLDRLLAEHAALAVFATHKGVSGSKDFPAIAAALDQNSVELGDAIGSVYGEEAGAQFLDGKLLWRDHIGFFVDYTKGLAAGDKAAQDKAVGNLMGYVAAQSAFLSKATGLPQDALKQEITHHVTQLKGSLDAFHAGNFTKAYAEERHAYHHMRLTADTLAGAIAEQKSDQFDQGDATKSAVDLRARLGELLGEHAILASIATQKGLDGDKDFAAAAAALDANTDELGEAVGSVAGAEGQEAFEKQWRAHIGFFVDYTKATASKDDAAKQKAVRDLQGYKVAVSQILGGATGLDPKDLEPGVQQHIEHLAGQVDAYAAGDYEKAYSLIRTAYEHMYMTGDTLAAAIVEQAPDKFES